MCTDWNLIREEGEVSAWYSPSTGWLAIGISPERADSWVIGRQSSTLIIQGQESGFHSLENAMDLWVIRMYE